MIVLFMLCLVVLSLLYIAAYPEHVWYQKVVVILGLATALMMAGVVGYAGSL